MCSKDRFQRFEKKKKSIHEKIYLRLAYRIIYLINKNKTRALFLFPIAIARNLSQKVGKDRTECRSVAFYVITCQR